MTVTVSISQRNATSDGIRPAGKGRAMIEGTISNLKGLSKATRLGNEDAFEYRAGTGGRTLR
jgi:hypothetical protein